MSKRPDSWEAESAIPTAMELATMNNIVKTGYDLSRLKECALQAGAEPNQAAQLAAGAIRKMGNNPKMQKALKKAGVSYEKVAMKLAELLDCKHPAYPDMPDNTNQGRALDLAFKVLDALPNPKLEIDKTETINVNISAEMIKRIEKVTGSKVIDVEPESVKGFFPEGS